MANINGFILTSPEGEKDYSIRGVVRDINTKEPLKNIIISLKDDKGKLISKTSSQTNGTYILKFKYDINIAKNSKSKHPLVLEYKSNKGYSANSYYPLTSDLEIKENISPIELDSKPNKTQETLTNISKIPKNVINTVKSTVKSDFDWIKNLFMNSINNIFNTLLPLIAGLLAQFGVFKLGGKKQQCPSQDQILDIVRKRNNTVKGLNNIYQTLNLMLSFTGASLTLITAFDLVKGILIKLPTPIFNGMPESTIHLKQENIKKLQKIVDQYKGLNITILVYITLLRGVISNLLDHLKVLDNHLQECYPNINSDNQLGIGVYLEPINLELQQINQTPESTNPILTQHNGFILKVTNLDSGSVHGLFKRQAIAINPQGVIALRGEPSFSSSDQILINELIFYINVNNLKAY